MMQAIWCAWDFLTQTDTCTGYLKLNGIVFVMFLVNSRRLIIDNLITDIPANIAQRRVLKVVPQAVNELVCELDSGA